MMWHDEFPESWDDAPADPPDVSEMPVKFKRLGDEYVLRPCGRVESGTGYSHSVRAEQLMDPNDLEERPGGPKP